MPAFRRVPQLRPLMLRGREFAWGSRTYIMGIINATPDSFSGDGIYRDVEKAVSKAREFAAAGCDIIDIGGESTRPQHQPVSDEEEASRVLPVLRAVRSAVSLALSVDTFKPKVAVQALAAGADMLNCVWGAVPGVVEAATSSGAPLVVMHNRAAPDYRGDCVAEILASLQRAAAEAQRAGVRADRIIVDPGIGFGKTADHNVEILGRLEEFVGRLPYPLLIGPSRKSFIGKITGLPADERSYGTAAAITLAIAAGVDIVRVHDVAQLVAAVRVADAVCRDGFARPHDAGTPAAAKGQA